MNAITRITGRAVPLPGNDIDTDRIIPARFLRCVTFDGLGEHAFADDRSQLKLAGQVHPFDAPAYVGARLLIVGSNFGCGSSREHAPQALKKWGISLLIGVSFAEIFFNNNVAIGVPCVSLTPAEIVQLQRLIKAYPQLEVEVDIERSQVRAGELQFALTLPEGARQMFLHGLWDATGQLVARLGAVRQRMAKIPYLNDF